MFILGRITRNPSKKYKMLYSAKYALYWLRKRLKLLGHQISITVDIFFCLVNTYLCLTIANSFEKIQKLWESARTLGYRGQIMLPIGIPGEKIYLHIRWENLQTIFFTRCGHVFVCRLPNLSKYTFFLQKNPDLAFYWPQYSLHRHRMTQKLVVYNWRTNLDHFFFIWVFAFHWRALSPMTYFRDFTISSRTQGSRWWSINKIENFTCYTP